MLTRKQHAAAIEVATNRRSFAKIASKAGVCLRTLTTWRASPEFQAEVERLLNLWAADVEKRGIADRRRRLYQVNLRWRAKQSLREQRAKMFRKLAKDDPQLAQVPGGNTGMVVWTTKMLHVGEQEYERIIEHEFDAALDAAMRADEEHVATDLGQWKPKHEISFAEDGGALRIQNLSALTDDELRTLIALARKLEVEGPPGGIKPPQPEPHGGALPEHGAAPPGVVPEAG
jgi:hypothetical protein